jgi:hypothetical protein
VLQHQLMEDKGILVLTPQGKLAEGDFAAVSGVVDPYIEKNGALRGILIDAPKFPGWENFAAMSSHLKFVKGHHQKVGKVAAVSDSALIKFAPTLAKHFVKAEVRGFEPSQREEAMAWLEG